MRRLILLLALCLLFGVTANAAVEQYDVTQFHAQVTVADDGSYTAAVTAHLSFSAADTAVAIPLGEHVDSADASGYSTRLREAADGIVWLTLSTDESFLLPGSFHFTFTGKLPHTVEDGKTAFSVPLLCAQWPGEVSGVTFEVTMPNAVELDTVQLTSGYYGEMTGETVTLSADAATLTGGFAGSLLDHESLSLDFTLDAGYFVEPTTAQVMFSPGRLVVPLLVTALLAYWFLTLRSPRTRCRTQMNPPDGVCAGDVPVLLHGTRPNAALTVVQWASLGYVSMYSGRSGSVALERAMGMGNERKSYEQRLFAALFAHAQTISGTDERFRDCCGRIERPLAAYWRRRMFDKRSGSPALLRFGAAVCCAVACYRAGHAIDQLFMPHWALGLLLAVPGLIGGILAANGCMAAGRRRSWAAAVGGLAALCAMLLLGGVTGVRVSMVLACAMACFSGFAGTYGGRRSRSGCDMLARLRSLRRFLTTAEPKQLRRLLRQDPQYFYRLLPFAEALGVGRAFAARFGDVHLEPCEWYQAGRGETQTASEFYAQFRAAVKAMGGQK